MMKTAADNVCICRKIKEPEMKEQIYTIPIHDAFNETSECPFCAMYKTLEDTTIAYVLSPAYMEVDVRGETNEQGFCQKHMERLFLEGNSLGMGLMLHSQLKAQHETVSKLLKDASAGKKFLKKAPDASALEAYRRFFKKSCYVCGRVEDTFARYFDSFFNLYKKESEFRAKFDACQGFCLDHFMLIYDQAGNHLKGSDLEAFREKCAKIQDENLKRVEDDIEWFTLKFDYRYADKPWKNSKDALQRTIQKLNSQFVEKGKK